MPPGTRSASAVAGSRFGVDVGSAVLRDGAVEPSPEFHIPVLSGTARPWDLADWQIATPEGFAADLAAAGRRSPAKLMARTRTAEGLTSIDSDGGWKLSLDLKDGGRCRNTGQFGPRDRQRPSEAAARSYRTNDGVLRSMRVR